MNGSKTRLTNHELLTLAVYLLGGESTSIDTEDIAVKAHELAPTRYTWRKYPEQINLELIRVYLSDAKKESNGRYLTGSGTRGWMLSPDGLAFARRHRSPQADVPSASSGGKSRAAHWLRRERARLLTDPAHRQYLEGGADAVSTQAAESFFRLDAYVTGSMRRVKLLRIVNAFGHDPDLAATVNGLANKLGGISNGER